MAIVKNNPLLAGVRGRIGDSIVIKQYKNRIVLSALPDMSRVKQTPLQKLYQQKFAAAVKYASEIHRDKTKRDAYAKKIGEGKSVYHAALKEYLGRVES